MFRDCRIARLPTDSETPLPALALKKKLFKDKAFSSVHSVVFTSAIGRDHLVSTPQGRMLEDL